MSFGLQIFVFLKAFFFLNVNPVGFGYMLWLKLWFLFKETRRFEVLPEFLRVFLNQFYWSEFETGNEILKNLEGFDSWTKLESGAIRRVFSYCCF